MSSVMFVAGWALTGICIGGLIVVFKSRFKK
ncbi:hypothetical protein SAMN05421578_10551 [Paenibacillus macquariensis]|uniref:MetS family NSS transporter small subunit n=1 Tax=Paenibacillus macquariensis TaxID=948756 RepID=A0ABY1JWV5_9BACL|nr:hypothetical protein SAMN05421578_10551 [Paenibacillus macquariensis]